jgi:hypothetical protein
MQVAFQKVRRERSMDAVRGHVRASSVASQPRNQLMAGNYSRILHDPSAKCSTRQEILNMYHMHRIGHPGTASQERSMNETLKILQERMFDQGWMFPNLPDHRKGSPPVTAWGRGILRYLLGHVAPPVKPLRRIKISMCAAEIKPA